MSILQPIARFDLSPLPPIAGVAVPPFTTAEQYREYGHSLGLAGIKPALPLGLAHSFFAACHGGYRAGLDEAAERAILAVAPTDEELAARDAAWTNLDADAPGLGQVLTSEELVEGLQREAARYEAAGGFVAEFLARAIAGIAGDVEVFRAASYAEWSAREHEMWASQYQCRECGARA